MKKAKISVDISELVKFKNSEKRVDWKNTLGRCVYITRNGEVYSFVILEYDEEKKKAKVKYNNDEYDIYTSSLLGGNIGAIIGTKVIDFRYNIGDVVETKRKTCKITDTFRSKNNSEKQYMCKCQDCGSIKRVSESKLLHRGFTCANCSDNISRPERVFLSILLQLGIKYEYQKLFDWSKKVKLDCNEIPKDRFYDFYIPSINTIVEINGELHYREGKWSNSRSLDYVRENDKFKELLAKDNGIDKYIVIDCEEPEIDYIKDSVINSELNNVFDLSKIDWYKCDLDSCVSLMKVCSDLWNSGMKSAVDISKEVSLSKATVITYLKKFNKLGLNDYNATSEKVRGARETQEKNKKALICLNNKMIFESVIDCVNQSENVFGVKLSQSKISEVCRGNRKYHRNYQFKYIKDLSDEEKLKYNIDLKKVS